MAMYDLILPTRFAPAGRAALADLEAAIISVNHDPLMQFVLETYQGIVLILNEERQVVAGNAELLKAFDYCLVDYKKGARLGELFSCIHANEGPAGCGTSERCRHCGAVLTILASQIANQVVDGECSLLLDRGAGLSAADFRVRAFTTTVNGYHLTYVFFQDISAIKRLKMLEEVFLRDFNDVVSGIEGWRKLLNPENITPVSGEMATLLKFLKDELDFQRQLLYAEQDCLQVKLQSCAPNDLLTTLVTIFSVHPAAKGCSLSAVAVHARQLLYTDPSLLLRVLINMVKNALENCPRGEVVRIWFERHGTAAGFLVHNPGMIPDDIQPHIFERYNSTCGPGHGLGTYSMKLFGEKYLLGKVSFTSTREEGTCFSIFLPVPPNIEAEAVAQDLNPKESNNGKAGGRILLVDDDESNALLSRFILEKMGYSVQVCQDGEESLNVFRAAPDAYYFVASDYAMDPMNGLDLARKILEINPKIPVLLLTGYDHPQLIREAKEAGVRAVSLKPSSADEFRELIQRIGL
jgi:CheY-like chemotaxis protein